MNVTERAMRDRPVVALHEVRHNLPTHLSSFVGRERELAEITAALATARVLTLTGAGGCGKSRLAARAAAQVLDRFAHGGWWVELAPITEPRMVQLALTQALGIRPGPGQSGLDAAIDYLVDRTALVVLDNCEHLADECAVVAETLALQCPGVTVLATSREPLRVDGEVPWPVPSLSLPPDGDDAVTLFVERARQFRPGFALTPEVTDLCRRLDGIPLAIELAAPRLRMLTIGQITDALSDRFALLAHGTRTAASRQKTLRASVDWSYDLLSDTERIVFRRLGVFLGGFTLDAAQQVCAIDLESAEVFAALTALVDKSLVQVDQHDTTTRYRLLETLRVYALECLDHAGETRAVRDRHRDHYVELAERLEPDLLTALQLDALAALDHETANLVQAIGRATATAPETALRLCVATTQWWWTRALFHQGQAAFRAALDAGSSEPSALRARALQALANMQAMTGDIDGASTTLVQALAVAQAIDDQRTIARCLTVTGMATVRADPVGARPWLEQARTLADSIGDEYIAGLCAMGLGHAHLGQTEPERCGSLLDEALRRGEAIGNYEVIAWSWALKAWQCYALGDLPRAYQAAQQSVATARAIGQVPIEVTAALIQSLVDIDLGDPDAAVELQTAMRQRATHVGAGYVLPATEAVLAHALAATGRLPDARQLAQDVVDCRGGGQLTALVIAQVGLAEILRLTGDLDGADAVVRDALHTHWVEANPGGLGAHLRLTLGRVAAASGECKRAHDLCHLALAAMVDTGFRPLLPAALEALATTTAGLGRHAEAARVLGAASHARDELGVVAWQHQRTEVDELRQRLRDILGEDAFEQARIAGQAMSIDDAVAYVQRMRGARGRPDHGWDSLTPAERQIAGLVGQGLTNPQIAQRLFVTPGTVKGHVSAILRKLDITNRTELAGEVARHA